MSRFTRPLLRKMLLSGSEPDWLVKHTRRDRVKMACLSAPPWVRERDFKSLIEEATIKTITTGVQHQIDHIVPVTHALVCGLTVPWNMQVIDKNLNARKGNKLHYAFQVELFNEPEQLRLI